jgi:isopenicillin-N epimerase
MTNLAALFLLTPEVVFLNHGSFGATPRPVFEVYQAWQRRLERQPVQFMVSELEESLNEARETLGRFVNAPADDLVYVPNATFGLNIVARSLALEPGDEVLATDHEYGACRNVWEFMSLKRGYRYVRQPIPMPFATQEEIADQFWRGVTAATKVIFISHITSPTAVRLPVEEICARAKQAGILSVVDGAHTVGQITLDMAAIGADFYLSNGHKWLCSPKGSAFLYTRRERQPMIEPLVVGWGWGPERDRTSGSDYVDFLQYLGTNDLSAYLAVPAAIAFQQQHNWTAVRQHCHALLGEAIARICALTGLETVYPDSTYYQQMAIAPLPHIKDLRAMKEALLDAYGVEVPLIDWKGRHFIRISIQGYNSREDIDALLVALEGLLPRHAAG